MTRISQRCFPNLLLLLVLSCVAWSTSAWSPASFAVLRSCSRHRKRLYAQNKEKSGNSDNDASTSTATTVTTTQQEWQDEDAGAGVVGAQFFGGNKEKEEFYDPVAEAQASNLAFVESSVTTTTFDRFQDRTAFDSDASAQLAISYQDFLNQALAGESTQTNIVFADNMQWESPFSTSGSNNNSLLGALQEAKQFYRRIHVAITSAKTLSEQPGRTYKLGWEIGMAWPTFWEPSILLTGSSQVNLVDNDDGGRHRIAKQVDVLDDPDLMGNLVRQILPRFWDVYHIGMTPTAEMSPAWERRQGFLPQNFVLYDVPARWVWTPTLVDRGNREDGNASFLPNHAFTTAIRTMGPSKDTYVPTTPTQIDIQPSPNGPNTIQWKVPLTVQLQAQREWPLFQQSNEPGNESSSLSSSFEDSSGSYVWQPARRVATLPTGIPRPQDEGITELRKRLYESVTAAGLKPKLDKNGRPLFFFWSAATKTCFTEKGLGMTVYEWRPEFAQSNHVGMELEATPELQRKD